MGIKKFIRCLFCVPAKKRELPKLFRDIYDPHYHDRFSYTTDTESIQPIPQLPNKTIENKNCDDNENNDEIQKDTDTKTTKVKIQDDKENNDPADFSSKYDDEQEHICFEDNRFNFWTYPVLIDYNYRKKRRALIKKGSLHRVSDLTLADISKFYVYHRYCYKVKKTRVTHF